MMPQYGFYVPVMVGILLFVAAMIREHYLDKRRRDDGTWPYGKDCQGGDRWGK